MNSNELDPAARAFEALRQEVRALGAQISRQDPTTDNTPILADIVDRLTAIEASPPPAAAPQAYAAGQQRASESLFRDLRKEVEGIRSQRLGLERLAAQFLSLRDRARWTAGLCGAVFGAVLVVFAIGPSLRAAPENWNWPEKAAAWLLDETVWDGGTRMLARTNPVVWDRLAEGYHLVEANQQTYEGCLRAAARAKREMVCKLKVRPPVGAARRQ